DVPLRVHLERAPVRMGAWVHVIAGRQPGDSLIHVWIPVLPGACFAVEGMEDVYEGLCAWADQWAKTNHVSDFSAITADFPARLETMEVDLGFPAAGALGEDEEPLSGRMRRPGTLAQVATNLTHHAD